MKRDSKRLVSRRWKKRLYNMLHEWMKRDSKRLVSRRRKKRKYPPAFLRHIHNELHAETGCRKVDAEKVFEQQINSMEAKETFGNGCDRNYTSSQSSDPNRQRERERLFLLHNHADL